MRWAATAGLIALSLTACVELNPDHCANNEGDLSCADGLMCDPMAAQDNGCVAVVSTTGTGTSGGPGPGTGPECEGPPDMPDPACGDGFCVDGTCVDCIESAQCSGDAPICDANACRGCVDHPECPESACNLETGACFPGGDAVRYVRAHDANDAGQATMDAPAETIARALELNAQTIVVMQSTDPAVDATATIPSGPIAIVGQPGPQSPEIFGTVTVTGGASVFIGNLRMDSRFSGQPVLSCDEARTWMTDIAINGPGEAISTDGCDTVVRRSRIYRCRTGGIDISRGTLWLENVALVDNGSDALEIDTLRAQNGAAVTAVYSTILTSRYVSTPVTCGNVGSLTIRNSILQSIDGPDVTDCDDLLTIEDSVSSQAFAGVPDVNYRSEDYSGVDSGQPRLVNTEPFEGVAVWRDGDPTHDFFGNERPAVDGSPDFPGIHSPG